MAFLDDLTDSWNQLIGFTPHDAAKDARAAAEPVVGRGPNGRIDPTAFGTSFGLAPDDAGKLGPDYKVLTGANNLRADAIGGMQPPERHWLSDIMRATSVPISSFQGNSSYANNMQNTLSNELGNRDSFAQDRQKALVDNVTGTINSAQTGTLGYLAKRRADSEEALRVAGTAVSSANIRTNGNKQAVAQAVKDAVAYLRARGLTQEADKFAATYGWTAQAETPPAATPTPAPAPAPAAPSASGPAVADPQIQGILRSAPGGPAPVTTGSVPAAPQQSPQPSVVGALESQLGQPMLSPKRETAARLAAIGDQDGAKVLEKQAELEEKGPIAAAEQLGKSRAEKLVAAQTEQPNAEKTLISTNNTLDSLENTVHSLMTPDGDLSPGLKSITGGIWAVHAPNIPGHPSADAQASLDTLKNRLGVEALNAMREASKTGGAVGQVTEKEWPILQSQIASLDPNQSHDRIRAQLGVILKHIQDVRGASRASYEATYGPRAEKEQPRTSVSKDDLARAPVGTEHEGYTKTAAGWVPTTDLKQPKFAPRGR